jgi:hypothetical protein
MEQGKNCSMEMGEGNMKKKLLLGVMALTSLLAGCGQPAPLLPTPTLEPELALDRGTLD